MARSIYQHLLDLESFYIFFIIFFYQEPHKVGRTHQSLPLPHFLECKPSYSPSTRYKLGQHKNRGWGQMTKGKKIWFQIKRDWQNFAPKKHKWTLIRTLRKDVNEWQIITQFTEYAYLIIIITKNLTITNKPIYIERKDKIPSKHTLTYIGV